MVDKLHLSEFDQDKEHVSSCERLCNIFNNHRNEGFAHVFHTELHLHGERSIQNQPTGKRHILINAAAAFPFEAAALWAALRCKTNKELSVSQKNPYHYRKITPCRRNKACQKTWCFVRAAAGSARQTGIPALHTHRQPPQGWHGPRGRSGLRCRAAPRIALGGSLCAIVEKKIVFKSSVFQK